MVIKLRVAKNAGNLTKDCPLELPVGYHCCLYYFPVPTFTRTYDCRRTKLRCRNLQQNSAVVNCTSSQCQDCTCRESISVSLSQHNNMAQSAHIHDSTVTVIMEHHANKSIGSIASELLNLDTRCRWQLQEPSVLPWENKTRYPLD